MTQDEFKHLYDVLAENNPGEYEYDGDAVISTHICKGIWVDIVNDAGSEGKDSWSTCYDLRNANGKLWERHVLDLEGKKQDIEEEVSRALEA